MQLEFTKPYHKVTESLIITAKYILFEDSDFKFGVLHWFAKVHHKIMQMEIRRGCGLREFAKFWQFLIII